MTCVCTVCFHLPARVCVIRGDYKRQTIDLIVSRSLQDEIINFPLSLLFFSNPRGKKTEEYRHGGSLSQIRFEVCEHMCVCMCEEANKRAEGSSVQLLLFLVSLETQERPAATDALQ